MIASGSTIQKHRFIGFDYVYVGIVELPAYLFYLHIIGIG
jgi:hypothetical protein